MSLALAQDIVPATTTGGAVAKALGRQQSLFHSENEPYLYHDPGRFGFFSILYQENVSDKKTQRSYRLPLMAEVIRCLPKDRDTWISQAEFILPNRRIVNLARISLLFAEIDCYNVGIRRFTCRATTR